MSYKIEKHDNNLLINDKFIGNVYLDVDGYYYFMPKQNNGLYSDMVLMEIAKFLIELNKPWNDKINEYFDKEKHNDNKTI